MALYAKAPTSDEKGKLEDLRLSSNGSDLSRRAEIVLLSASHRRVHEISSAVGLHPINVRKWIHRYNHFGIRGLYPRRSPGRPRLFSDGQRQVIIDLAMSDPVKLGLPFSSWSLQRLRSQLIARGVIEEISAETIRQELLHKGLSFEGRYWTRPVSAPA